MLFSIAALGARVAFRARELERVAVPAAVRAAPSPCRVNALVVPEKDAIPVRVAVYACAPPFLMEDQKPAGAIDAKRVRSVCFVVPPVGVDAPAAPLPIALRRVVTDPPTPVLGSEKGRLSGRPPPVAGGAIVPMRTRAIFRAMAPDAAMDAANASVRVLIADPAGMLAAPSPRVTALISRPAGTAVLPRSGSPNGRSDGSPPALDAGESAAASRRRIVLREMVAVGVATAGGSP
jgi:hypothetical protein